MASSFGDRKQVQDARFDSYLTGVKKESCYWLTTKRFGESENKICCKQARNQDFMWGVANEAKVDQTTEMYFLLSDPFI